MAVRYGAGRPAQLRSVLQGPLAVPFLLNSKQSKQLSMLHSGEET